jgi:hypothetical protein
LRKRAKLLRMEDERDAVDMR